MTDTNTSTTTRPQAAPKKTMVIIESMLSTSDNPFDPFTQFKPWYSFDVSAGYHTLSLLARIARSSSELSEADQQLVYDDAIDEILRENVSGRHIRVTREIEVEV